MKKILFLIHDLGPGGAEKVLVNLVNNMNPAEFDVTVMTLFDVGVNKQFLAPHVRYIGGFPKMFPGNSHLMKLFSPALLHSLFIKEKYDIEVSYLEGPSARVISGCQSHETKLVSWIHVEQHTKKTAAQAFCSYGEAKACYRRFHRTVCVSEYVKNDFLGLFPEVKNAMVLYNTNESAEIICKSQDVVEHGLFSDEEIKLVGVGKLMPNKRFDMLVRIHKRLLKDGYKVHTYILGAGPEEQKIRAYIRENDIADSITMLGYQTNPYKFVARCDLFVCTSLAEGFSTAATEALIVGTPVCTVDVSGMKEMLGDNNEYGVVTENDEDAFFEGLKRLLDDSQLLANYKIQAKTRGEMFSTEKTVKAVEDMLLENDF